MQIGIPKEIKPYEGRVGLVPAAAAELVHAGHTVWLQSQAGVASGFSDDDYENTGVKLCKDAHELYKNAELIVKIKEPTPAEYELLESRHTVFSFLHLAANPGLTETLCKKQVTALAFETLDVGGALPLLAPMSEVAGRLSVYYGAQLLLGTAGGKGILLGGLPSAERGHVVILGAGVAGRQAAMTAAAMGARITIFDKLPAKLEAMHELGANITALPPYAHYIRDAVQDADLLIGAVLLPGGRAPKLVTKEQIKSMRAGSVVIDISVDQGGCIETIRPTDYKNPTYVVDEVTHFGVTNIPGAVPRTASQMLSVALLPYCLQLAEKGGADKAVFKSAINVANGRIMHDKVAHALQK